ncbi:MULTISPECIES: YsnF/AvaK domain-containing protein [unclassified Rathayibacter]|uniref:YsnF/AvaK domain-containing protein n=1 Tax=unclassified Rathayibacter TaxID=2609250 RepID=UPI0010483985|nr:MULTISPECIES: YsnF/AvaK domain-containing protein [unclassified Rathayibacter]TCL79391.1 uncharacterized protein (TIGR02271 family) [Rathayibacter sp. PhB192]TCM25341.1 uncharacterized protein (TIGR02271 family) [Rathayibacter sp. PhB179]
MNDRDSSPAPEEPITVIRSEERLDVTTVWTPMERLRVRKVVVTEERTITVTLRREELVIERESLEQPPDGAGLGPRGADSEPITLVLHAEQPVLTTRVLPVERVHVVIDRILEMRSATETIRKERVDVRTVANLLDDNAG